jgi:hypothetical protein
MNLIRRTLCLWGLAIGSLVSAQALPSGDHLSLLQRGTFLLNGNSPASLSLSPSQSKTIGIAFSRYYSQQDSLLKRGTEPKALKGLDVEVTRDVLAVLNAKQRKGLLKLAVREVGYQSLLTPDLAQALALTSPQLDRIRSVFDAAAKPGEDLEAIIARRTSEEPSKSAEIRASYRSTEANLKKQRHTAEAAALKMLTPTQLKLWHSYFG